MLKAVLRKSRPYTPSQLRTHISHSQYVRLWMRLVWDGFKDLTPTVAEHIEEVGDRPRWLESSAEVEEAMGWGAGEHWTKFALEEGLAPNQLFLVEFTPPVVTQIGYEHVEYEVDYDWEIIEAAPWSKSKTLKAWARWLHRGETLNALYEANRAEELRIVSERTDLMHVVITTNDNRYIGTKGTTYTAQLWTSLRPRGGFSLLYGKEQPTIDESVDALADAACKRYQRLSPELVHDLPRNFR